MTWVRLDDQFFAHPKVIELSKDAKLLYLAALTHCSAQLTDGALSNAAIRAIAALVDVERSAARELVAVGLWERLGTGYNVHDYLKYNRTRDKVKAEREANAERQARFRSRHTGDDNGVTPSIKEVTPLVCGPQYTSHTDTEIHRPEDTLTETRDDVDELIASTADLITSAAFIRDEPDDVRQAIARSFTLTPVFNARDGPREAEKFVRYYARRKRALTDWYVTWLDWIKRAADQQPKAAADEPYPDKVKRWKATGLVEST